MAAPNMSDIGSSVTFEKNDKISVLTEVLDITVNGSVANVVAKYRMKNTANESVSTPAMFLSPSIEYSDAKVLVDDKMMPFTNEHHVLTYGTEVIKKNWKYAVLTNEEEAGYYDKTVDALFFVLNFEPSEAYDVTVSYSYRLGGYPDYDFDVKRGEIEYFLTPAAMWKDFSGLTINLFLDESMPVLKSSNLPFVKTGERTYTYYSDTLPEEDLTIIIDENWFQNILSTFRNPYLLMSVMMFLPFILIFAAVVVTVILLIIRKSRKNKHTN